MIPLLIKNLNSKFLKLKPKQSEMLESFSDRGGELKQVLTGRSVYFCLFILNGGQPKLIHPPETKK